MEQYVSFILTMWYVNVVTTFLGVSPEACFILTMWYVNLAIELSFDFALLVLY